MSSGDMLTAAQITTSHIRDVLTFPDCADEYAGVLASQDADMDAMHRATALGYEPGTAGWEKWTAATTETAQSSWDAHETCIAERYGEGLDIYKALVLER